MSIPQLDVEFIQVLQDMIGDLTNSPEPIEIKLFAQDPELLKKWAPKVGERIKKIKGVADVKDGIENTVSGSAIIMNVDPVVAARSGFTPQEIELDASAVLQGEPATTPVVVNDRSYTIRVRFPVSARLTLDDVRNTMITSSAHGQVRVAGHTGRVSGRSRANRSDPRKSAAPRGCHRTLRRHQPGRRHQTGASCRWTNCTCRPQFAWPTVELMRSSRSPFAIC